MGDKGEGGLNEEDPTYPAARKGGGKITAPRKKPRGKRHGKETDFALSCGQIASFPCRIRGNFVPVNSREIRADSVQGRSHGNHGVTYHMQARPIFPALLSLVSRFSIAGRPHGRGRSAFLPPPVMATTILGL